jgi:hypothetical protein
MEGLSLPRRKAKQFKKETKPQAMQRLSLLRKWSQIVSEKKTRPQDI